jgi:hypothetical protein
MDETYWEAFDKGHEGSALSLLRSHNPEYSRALDNWDTAKGYFAFVDGLCGRQLHSITS